MQQGSGFLQMLLGSNPVGFGVGAGLQTIGNLLGVRSERRRLEELRAKLEETLKPEQARLNQAQFGLSQSEGALAQSAERSTLSDLANRGVLESSGAPAEVAQAVAPFELRRQETIRGTERSLAAARQAIAGETSLPGYGGAFGEGLGQIGGFLALRQGVEEGKRRGRNMRLERLLDLMGDEEQVG